MINYKSIDPILLDTPKIKEHYEIVKSLQTDQYYVVKYIGLLEPTFSPMPSALT